MRTLKRTSLPVLLLLLTVLACALPEIAPAVEQPADGTSAAATVLAIVKMTQEAAGVSVVSSDTPLVTFTPSITPTLTLTPTVTLTVTPLATITPLVPMISVSVATNCRTGPGKIYEMVGALLVGEVAQVYARDPGNNYWYIRNPDDPSQYCWVWGEFATLSGMYAVLPMYTPPPTPTRTATPTVVPGFDASFGGLESCSGWWVDVDIENTGSITFKSVSISVKDTDTDTVVTNIQDGFTDLTGCSSTTNRTALAPGKTAGESSPKFAYDITGHKLRATLTLCSDTSMDGTCVTDTITFTP